MNFIKNRSCYFQNFKGQFLLFTSHLLLTNRHCCIVTLAGSHLTAYAFPALVIGPLVSLPPPSSLATPLNVYFTKYENYIISFSAGRIVPRVGWAGISVGLLRIKFLNGAGESGLAKARILLHLVEVKRALSAQQNYNNFFHGCLQHTSAIETIKL